MGEPLVVLRLALGVRFGPGEYETLCLEMRLGLEPPVVVSVSLD